MIQQEIQRRSGKARIAAVAAFMVSALVTGAQASANSVVWQHDDDFVRIESAEGSHGGGDASSLPLFGKEAVHAILAAIKVSGSGGEDTFLTDSQVDTLTDPVTRALHSAAAGEDVAFAIHFRGGVWAMMGPPRTCAGRIFIDGGAVNVIVAMMQESYLANAVTVDAGKIHTGSRAVQQLTGYQVVPGGAISLAQNGRTDWVRISPVLWTGNYTAPPAGPAMMPTAAPAMMPTSAPAMMPVQPEPATPSAVMSAPAPQDPSQIEQRFTTLKRLLDSHLITEQDYEKAKADLLKAISTVK